MTVTGIVLAGGRSSRFRASGPGGATGPAGPTATAGSKLDADLGGRSVLDRAIRAISMVVDDVVVVGRSGGPAPGDRVRFVDDAEPFAGPVPALVTGLEACPAEEVLVVAGDMPLLRPGVLQLLAGRLRGAPGVTAVLLAVGDDWQPFPMALRRDDGLVSARAALGAGERSLLAFVARLAVLAVPESAWRPLDPDGDSIRDVDTLADLEELRRRR